MLPLIQSQLKSTPTQLNPNSTHPQLNLAAAQLNPNVELGFMCHLTIFHYVPFPIAPNSDPNKWLRKNE